MYENTAKKNSKLVPVCLFFVGGVGRGVIKKHIIGQPKSGIIKIDHKIRLCGTAFVLFFFVLDSEKLMYLTATDSRQLQLSHLCNNLINLTLHYIGPY